MADQVCHHNVEAVTMDLPHNNAENPTRDEEGVLILRTILVPAVEFPTLVQVVELPILMLVLPTLFHHRAQILMPFSKATRKRGVRHVVQRLLLLCGNIRMAILCAPGSCFNSARI